MNEDRSGEAEEEYTKTILIDRSKNGFWILYSWCFVDYEANEIMQINFKHGYRLRQDYDSLAEAINAAKFMIEEYHHFYNSKILVVCQEMFSLVFRDEDAMLIETEQDAVEAVLRFS